MIIAAIIVGIILIFFMFLTSYMSGKEYSKFDDGAILGMIIAILTFIESSLIACIIVDSKPTAMDVYQGKTTLEYKVDSVVIFKNDADNLNIY